MKHRQMILAAFFAALLAVSSYIIIPIGLVPHTMQVAFIFLAGLILGAKWGSVSVLVWFFIGIIGLPVFANAQSGITTFIGPTGGFLLGFLLAAFIVGWFADRGLTTFWRTFIVAIIALVVIYAVGIVGFMLSLKYVLNKPMTWSLAFKLVVIPFLPFDLLKAAIASYLSLKVKKALIFIK